MRDMDLLSIWYSVVDEGQSDVRYQPSDALYLNNYINATMRNIKPSIALVASDQRPRLKTAD
jgi:hypothetical protein